MGPTRVNYATLGRRFWAVACFMAGVGAAGCSPGHESYYGTVKPRHPPDEVWTNNGTEPEYIDPGKCSDSAGSTVIFNIFAGLTQPHPVTLEPMPDVAKGWEITDGGRTYTFHLRKMNWSDGMPVTARDYEYAWKRVLAPATASKYASFMYVLQGGRAFNRRAVRLKGLADEMNAEALKAELEKIVPVAEVQLHADRPEAFVYVGGEMEEADAHRKQLIDSVGRREILGAQLTAEMTAADAVGLKALDDYTLEARLHAPVPYFLDVAMFYTAMPVPRHLLERLKKEGKNADLWTRVEHIVSNGPYKLTDWKFRQYMSFEKNPEYWDAENVKVSKVRLAMVENYNTSLNLYKAGEFDYIGTNLSLPAEFMDTLDDYQDFIRYPYLASYFYWVNTERPPMDDPRVRKALSLTIDRKAIVEHVTRAGQIPTADLVPEGVGGYPGLGSKLFDPERAKALLKEAGYSDPSKVPPITLIYNTSEGHKQIAEAIQQMWKKHLGIEVAIENQEWKVFLKNLQMMNFQVARMGWIGDYADPYTFLELLTAANGNNHSNWSSEKFDQLLYKANATLDPDARMALLLEAEKILKEAAPLLPIYIYTRSEVVKPYLMGHYPNYQNRHPFKYWWIDERWYDGIPDAPLETSPPPMLVPDPAPTLTPDSDGAQATAGTGEEPSDDPPGGSNATAQEHQP